MFVHINKTKKLEKIVFFSLLYMYFSHYIEMIIPVLKDTVHKPSDSWAISSYKLTGHYSDLIVNYYKAWCMIVATKYTMKNNDILLFPTLSFFWRTDIIEIQLCV